MSADRRESTRSGQLQVSSGHSEAMQRAYASERVTRSLDNAKEPPLLEGSLKASQARALT